MLNAFMKASLCVMARGTISTHVCNMTTISGMISGLVYLFYTFTVKNLLEWVFKNKY
jgi:hypothetical protein